MGSVFESIQLTARLHFFCSTTVHRISGTEGGTATSTVTPLQNCGCSAHRWFSSGANTLKKGAECPEACVVIDADSLNHIESGIYPSTLLSEQAAWCRGTSDSPRSSLWNAKKAQSQFQYLPFNSHCVKQTTNSRVVSQNCLQKSSATLMMLNSYCMFFFGNT